MKNAFISFVNALSGIPTQFSVTRFGTSASVLQGFTSNTTDVIDAINSVSTGGGGTDWEEGLSTAYGTFDPRQTKPNLIIFASDGNPTFPHCSGNSTCPADVEAAVVQANLIKNDWIRILAIGIGNDLNVAKLMAISGPNVNTGDVLTSDVITTDFSGLAAQLATFASQTCGGTITVQKLIDDDGSLDTVDDRTVGPGWTFDIGGTSKITDDNGQTEAVEKNAGTYSVTETVQPGYSLLSASCNGATNNGSQSGNSINGIQISDTNIVSCTFINTPNYTPTRICHATSAHPNPYISQTPATMGQLMGHAGHTGPVWYPGITVDWGDIIPPIPVFLPSGLNWSTEGQAIWNNGCNIPPQTGSIKIIKDVVPDDSSTWNFTISGPSGTFNINGLGDGESRTIDDLLPGSYNITEITNSDYLTQVTCGGVGPLNQNGFLGTVTAGQTLECTFTNTRNPYCGDGIKNGQEQCDGTDGVTPGQNFCTKNCTLVPIYDGAHSCPSGTVRSQNPIWSGTISATDPDGEAFSLTAGGKYLFEASGTFIPTSAAGYLSDAAYTTINGVLSNEFGIHGTGNDYAAHALLANLGSGVGVVDWGNYNSDHIYTKYYEPTINNVQFVIGDRYGDWFDTSWQNQTGMSDNSGGLTLNVYECQEYGSVTVRKFEDKNGNAYFDEGEPLLGGWDIALSGTSKQTVNGVVVFDNLTPGEYDLTESIPSG